MEAHRVDLRLDPEHAAKLSELAEDRQMAEAALAEYLLHAAIDEAESEGERMTEILDGIPGAFERAEQGRRDAEEGRTIPLSDLTQRGPLSA